MKWLRKKSSHGESDVEKAQMMEQLKLPNNRTSMNTHGKIKTEATKYC
jgi:hypothetical protein